MFNKIVEKIINNNLSVQYSEYQGDGFLTTSYSCELTPQLSFSLGLREEESGITETYCHLVSDLYSEDLEIDEHMALQAAYKLSKLCEDQLNTPEVEEIPTEKSEHDKLVMDFIKEDELD